MSTISALSSIISILHRDMSATIAQAGEAFGKDFGHFARSNNREPLNMAVRMLGKSPMDKALVEAISEGYKTAGLAVGYIGAQSGPFAKQSPEIQKTFNDAIDVAVTAFTAHLTASPAFQTKAPKTQAEKDQAKAEKAQKAQETLEAAITAKVQNGELVRASDIKPFPQEEIDSLKALVEALTNERNTLAATLDAVTAERDTLLSEKTTKKSRKVAA